MSVGSSDPASRSAPTTSTTRSNKRTLLSMQANENLDLAEQYRAKQEDLEIQRAAAADATERATQNSADGEAALERAADGPEPAAGLRGAGRRPPQLGAGRGRLAEPRRRHAVGEHLRPSRPRSPRRVAAQRAADAARAAAPHRPGRAAASGSAVGPAVGRRRRSTAVHLAVPVRS